MSHLPHAFVKLFLSSHAATWPEIFNQYIYIQEFSILLSIASSGKISLRLYIFLTFTNENKLYSKYMTPSSVTTYHAVSVLSVISALSLC